MAKFYIVLSFLIVASFPVLGKRPFMKGTTDKTDDSDVSDESFEVYDYEGYQTFRSLLSRVRKTMREKRDPWIMVRNYLKKPPPTVADFLTGIRLLDVEKLSNTLLNVNQTFLRELRDDFVNTSAFKTADGGTPVQSFMTELTELVANRVHSMSMSMQVIRQTFVDVDEKMVDRVYQFLKNNKSLDIVRWGMEPETALDHYGIKVNKDEQQQKMAKENTSVTDRAASLTLQHLVNNSAKAVAIVSTMVDFLPKDLNEKVRMMIKYDGQVSDDGRPKNLTIKGETSFQKGKPMGKGGRLAFDLPGVQLIFWPRGCAFAVRKILTDSKHSLPMIFKNTTLREFDENGVDITAKKMFDIRPELSACEIVEEVGTVIANTNISADCIHATIKLSVDEYGPSMTTSICVALENGTVVQDEEIANVLQGQVKISQNVTGYEMCCESNFTMSPCYCEGYKGSKVEFRQAMLLPGSAAPQLRTPPPAAKMPQQQQPSLYDTGAGSSLVLSTKVYHEGRYETMEPGYPKLELQGSHTVMILMFANFTGDCVYDPTVSTSTKEGDDTAINNVDQTFGDTVAVAVDSGCSHLQFSLLLLLFIIIMSLNS